MTEEIQDPPVTKNDLIKDYINFGAVILLSLFFKYSILDLAESIWIFSVAVAISLLLVQLKKCFDYDNFSFPRMVNIIGTGVAYGTFYLGMLLCLREGLGYKDVPITVKEFIFYIPFIPFALFPYKQYYKDFVWQDKINVVSLIVFLMFLKLSILIMIIAYLQLDEKLCFYVVYTLFFFPFTKTYKFLKQKGRPQ